jgi:DNA-binding transcriptional ArsR family regulator
MIDIADDKRSPARTEWLTALADPTRQRILQMLGEAPRTASEIYDAFPIADPAVSRHLRVLRECGLVNERRIPKDRRVRLYTLEPQPLRDLSAWLEEIAGMWQSQLGSFRGYVALRRPRSDGDR